MMIVKMNTKISWKSFLFLVASLITACDTESINQCPDYQIHFEKLLGYRPLTMTSLSPDYGVPFVEKILLKSYNQVPSVINLQCMELCKNDHNCESYVLNFKKSECYGFTSNDRYLQVLNLRRLEDRELEEDINVVYFVKTCMNS